MDKNLSKVAGALGAFVLATAIVIFLGEIAVPVLICEGIVAGFCVILHDLLNKDYCPPPQFNQEQPFKSDKVDYTIVQKTDYIPYLGEMELIFEQG